MIQFKQIFSLNLVHKSRRDNFQNFLTVSVLPDQPAVRMLCGTREALIKFRSSSEVLSNPGVCQSGNRGFQATVVGRELSRIAPLVADSAKQSVF